MHLDECAVNVNEAPLVGLGSIVATSMYKNTEKNTKKFTEKNTEEILAHTIYLTPPHPTSPSLTLRKTI